MGDILAMLKGGNRRSIGRANKVAAQVLGDPAQIETLIIGMQDEDPIVRMRAADAAEKVCQKAPDLFQPFKAKLLALALAARQHELRWHLALILPRLDLAPEEIDIAAAVMFDYVGDKSRIVTVCAADALAQFAERLPGLHERVRALVVRLVATGSPAVRSRARKLLARLNATPGASPRLASSSSAGPASVSSSSAMPSASKAPAGASPPLFATPFPA